MGITNLDGTLVSGPPSATDNNFPSGTESITIHTATYPKSWSKCTGAQQRSVSVTIGGATWVTLSGIGATDTVTKADFFYMRCDSMLLVEVTQATPSGTPLVATRYLQGPMMLQSPSGYEITLVRVQGSATLEYHAEGQA